MIFQFTFIYILSMTLIFAAEKEAEASRAKAAKASSPAKRSRRNDEGNYARFITQCIPSKHNAFHPAVWKPGCVTEGLSLRPIITQCFPLATSFFHTTASPVLTSAFQLQANHPRAPQERTDGTKQVIMLDSQHNAFHHNTMHSIRQSGNPAV
jgi:hypothetical protein